MCPAVRKRYALPNYHNRHHHKDMSKGILILLGLYVTTLLVDSFDSAVAKPHKRLHCHY